MLGMNCGTRIWLIIAFFTIVLIIGGMFMYAQQRSKDKHVERITKESQLKKADVRTSLKDLDKTIETLKRDSNNRVITLPASGAKTATYAPLTTTMVDRNEATTTLKIENERSEPSARSEGGEAKSLCVECSKRELRVPVKSGLNVCAFCEQLMKLSSPGDRVDKRKTVSNVDTMIGSGDNRATESTNDSTVINDEMLKKFEQDVLEKIEDIFKHAEDRLTNSKLLQSNNNNSSRAMSRTDTGRPTTAMTGGVAIVVARNDSLGSVPNVANVTSNNDGAHQTNDVMRTEHGAAVYDVDTYDADVVNKVNDTTANIASGNDGSLPDDRTTGNGGQTAPSDTVVAENRTLATNDNTASSETAATNGTTVTNVATTANGTTTVTNDKTNSTPVANLATVTNNGIISSNGTRVRGDAIANNAANAINGTNGGNATVVPTFTSGTKSVDAAVISTAGGSVSGSGSTLEITTATATDTTITTTTDTIDDTTANMYNDTTTPPGSIVNTIPLIVTDDKRDNSINSNSNSNNGTNQSPDKVEGAAVTRENRSNGGTVVSERVAVVTGNRSINENEGSLSINGTGAIGRNGSVPPTAMTRETDRVVKLMTNSTEANFLNADRKESTNSTESAGDTKAKSATNSTMTTDDASTATSTKEMNRTTSHINDDKAVEDRTVKNDTAGNAISTEDTANVPEAKDGPTGNNSAVSGIVIGNDLQQARGETNGSDTTGINGGGGGVETKRLENGIETSPRDTIQNGTVQNGTVVNGTVRNGTVQNGTVQNEAVENGTVPIGTNGTAPIGSVQNGTVQNGTVPIGTKGTAPIGNVQNGTAQNETVLNGANGTVQNGTTPIGTVQNETVQNGAAQNGTAPIGSASNDNDSRKIVGKPMTTSDTGLENEATSTTENEASAIEPEEESDDVTNVDNSTRVDDTTKVNDLTSVNNATNVDNLNKTHDVTNVERPTNVEDSTTANDLYDVGDVSTNEPAEESDGDEMVAGNVAPDSTLTSKKDNEATIGATFGGDDTSKDAVTRDNARNNTAASRVPDNGSVSNVTTSGGTMTAKRVSGQAGNKSLTTITEEVGGKRAKRHVDNSRTSRLTNSVAGARRKF